MKPHSMALLLFAAICALGITSKGVAQEPSSQKVTGIYSDMQYNREGGDVVGQEVFIVFSKSGYFAILQLSEGEPSAPVVVPVKVAGSAVTFTVPTEMDTRGTFKGNISGGHLVGTFSGNGQKVDLKRKSSYWQ